MFTKILAILASVLIIFSDPDIDLEIIGSADIRDLVWDAVHVEVRDVEGSGDPVTIQTGDRKSPSTSTESDASGHVSIHVGVDLPSLYYKVVEPHQLKELTQYSLGNLWILTGIAHSNDSVEGYIKKLRAKYGCHLDNIFPFYALKLFNSPLYLQEHFIAAMMFYGEPFVRTLELAGSSGLFRPEVEAVRQNYRFDSTDYEKVLGKYGCSKVIFEADDSDELKEILSIADLTFFKDVEIVVKMPLTGVEVALIDSLSSDSLNFKRNASLLLSDFETDNARSSLVEGLPEERDLTTRFRMIYSLSLLGDEALPGLLHEMIREEERDFIMVYLITALGRRGNDGSVALISDILRKSGNYDVLVSCLRSGFQLISAGHTLYWERFLESLPSVLKNRIKDPRSAYKPVRSQKMLEIKDIHRRSHRRFELDIAVKLLKAMLGNEAGDVGAIIKHVRSHENNEPHNFAWLVKEAVRFLNSPVVR